MLVSLFIVGVGLVVLGAAGELFVRAAITVAHRFKLSSFVIGLTIVAFGTSLPELTVSVQATLAGEPEIAVGNVVGSNIANILLVMGVVALLKPFAAHGARLRRDGLVMIFASLLVIGLSYLELVPRFVGVTMLAGLVLYTLYQLRIGASDDDTVEEPELPGGMKVAVPAVVVSLGGLIFGADMLIRGATDIARIIGVSEAVIGLTMVAVGTSLPELAISAVAAIRGHAAVAVGNVIGSNIFNILMILGAAISVGPVSIPSEIANRDVWVMAGTSFMVLFLIWSGGRMTRLEGGIALSTYILYIGFLFAAGQVG